MTVVFDSVTLPNPSPFDVEVSVLINESVLLTGKRSVQASTATAIRVTFKCFPASASDVSTMKGKIGTSGTLSIDGTLYAKCYISTFSYYETMPGQYTYTVGFIQDTT